LLLTVGLLLGRLEVATITLQILLSCLTVFMIYRTALLLFEPQRTAIIAAVLYALDPFSILFASLIAPETVFGTSIRLDRINESSCTLMERP
jgi:4-amino-4-deoxy-L-arabinose transferase-like glycosyltransferase